MSARYQYFLVYKPYGVLSQFTDETGRKKVLKELYDFPGDVYPVGRLDEKSEGLLLLCNDKKLIKNMQDKPLEKEYWVQVEGLPTTKDLVPLTRGVMIKVKKKTHRTQPARVKILDEEPQLPPRNPPIRYRKHIPVTWISVTIQEGKYRQVRKMTAAVGFPTLRLVRARLGDLQIGNMKPGEVRIINRKLVNR